jgi:uncharacterized cofD-like protein
VNEPTRVTIVGGGTGIYPVTTALKKIGTHISTVVGVSDSGGSSGKIRDEFGFQPVGDLRQSLAALAEGEGQEWIRRLLLYRFSKGGSLKGHNLGNLILTALQDMTGNTSEALFRAQQIFRLDGQVIPAANEIVDIEITYLDGSVLVGEDYLNPDSGVEKEVKSIRLVPSATANHYAIEAIEQAEYIFIGPGDYYASLLATLLPDGMQTAFQKTKAKIIFISNLMTRHLETDHMGVAELTQGVETVIDHPIDWVIVNSQPIPEQIVEVYHKYREHPVEDNLHDNRVIRAQVIADMPIQQIEGDALQRSYLRHDSDKLIKVFEQIFAKK